jgi:hypothetical protein
VKLWGREPTVILQAISAGLALVVAIGIPGLPLDADLSALLVAAIGAVFGALNAWAVTPRPPAAFLAVVAAVVPIAARFGFEASTELVGALNAFIVVVLALMTRQQVTPVADPRPISPSFPNG